MKLRQTVMNVIVEVGINKTHTQAKKTGTGMACKLYEQRSAWTDLSKFFKKTTETDPTCGLAQTCEINNTDNTIPTRFGYSPPPPPDHLADIN